MRFLLLYLAILYVSINVLSGQTFEANYLGKNFVKYRGRYLKIKDISKSSIGYSYMFYKDLKSSQQEKSTKVAYPDTKFIFLTNPDSLANKIFIVENVLGMNGLSYSDTTLFNEYPIYLLRDTTTKEILYYKYDFQFGTGFPFLLYTSKAEYEEALCSNIEKKVDDFTGDITYATPIETNGNYGYMQVLKEVKKTKSSFYLYLYTYGESVNVNCNGATVLFDDGTKWVKQVKINVAPSKYGYEYSANILLSQTDLITFSTKKVKKYRLCIYDQEIDTQESDLFKIYTKCIKNLNIK